VSVRGIQPIRRARRDDPTDLTASELAAMPDATAQGDRALLALEEALNLFAASCEAAALKMPGKSSIEWTDATWNPTTGCDRISPGCDHCYALTLAARLKAMGSPPTRTTATRARAAPASA
jgi:hypothetical protein